MSCAFIGFILLIIGFFVYLFKNNVLDLLSFISDIIKRIF